MNTPRIGALCALLAGVSSFLYAVSVKMPLIKPNSGPLLLAVTGLLACGAFVALFMDVRRASLVGAVLGLVLGIAGMGDAFATSTMVLFGQLLPLPTYPEFLVVRPELMLALAGGGMVALSVPMRRTPTMPARLGPFGVVTGGVLIAAYLFGPRSGPSETSLSTLGGLLLVPIWYLWLGFALYSTRPESVIDCVRRWLEVTSAMRLRVGGAGALLAGGGAGWLMLLHLGMVRDGYWVATAEGHMAIALASMVALVTLYSVVWRVGRAAALCALLLGGLGHVGAASLLSAITMVVGLCPSSHEVFVDQSWLVYVDNRRCSEAIGVVNLLGWHRTLFFAPTGCAIAVLSWLVLRSRTLSARLGGFGMVTGTALVATFVISRQHGESPAWILLTQYVPAAYGLVPIWYAWLGLALFRARPVSAP